jgi:hypothetical protein
LVPNEVLLVLAVVGVQPEVVLVESPCWITAKMIIVVDFDRRLLQVFLLAWS